MMTIRHGFSWSDSSRRSATIGSFLACICAAICSSTLAPDTWCGSAVTTMSPSSTRYTARVRTEPRPVS
ncbi:hypothetical protein D3C81_1294170 [compost metagenome]